MTLRYEILSANDQAAVLAAFAYTMRYINNLRLGGSQ